MTSTSKLSSLISGTRRAVLEYLLETDANAVTLGEQLNINISAIRGHLDVLEIAGLVSSRREHAKRGRPKRIYYLTPKAHSLFPQQTIQIFVAFIHSVVQSFDVKTSNSLIRQAIVRLWQQILPKTPSGSLLDQLEDVVQALDNYGCYASLELLDDHFAIVIRNDVFQPALNALPDDQVFRFQHEFWNHLEGLLSGIRVRIAKRLDPKRHGYRILVEERKE